MNSNFLLALLIISFQHIVGLFSYLLVTCCTDLHFFFFWLIVCSFQTPQRNYLYCCEMGESFWGSFVPLTNLVLISHLFIMYFLFMFSFCMLVKSCNLFMFTANAVLEGACERVIVGDLYCDIPLGLYVIRGENVVLIGELVCMTILFFFTVNLWSIICVLN